MCADTQGKKIPGETIKNIPGTFISLIMADNHKTDDFGYAIFGENRRKNQDKIIDSFK